ncbi:MAG: DUF721 domain-containing protein [Lacipirellulaceae bacterium]
MGNNDKKRDSAAPEDCHPEDWQALHEKRKKQRGWWYHRREPKQIADVVAQLVQRKGYAGVQAAREWDEAWQQAVGEKLAKVTSPGAMKRGVLEVIVANSLLMQELGFDKERLLQAMQTALPESGIKQLRFKVGKV